MTGQDIQYWAKEIAAWREEKGFATSWDNARQKLFLTICEIAEAGECVRKGKWDTFVGFDGKPEGFPSEIADAAIRLLDLTGSLELEMPEFQPSEVENCSRETMLDALMTVTGQLWIASEEIDAPAWFADHVFVALGQLYTISANVGFDLLEEIARKHEFNKGRPYRHGTVNAGAA